MQVQDAVLQVLNVPVFAQKYPLQHSCVALHDAPKFTQAVADAHVHPVAPLQAVPLVLVEKSRHDRPVQQFASIVQPCAIPLQVVGVTHVPVASHTCDESQHRTVLEQLWPELAQVVLDVWQVPLVAPSGI
jgi:hypothetical protein